MGEEKWCRRERRVVCGKRRVVWGESEVVWGEGNCGVWGRGD